MSKKFLLGRMSDAGTFGHVDQEVKAELHRSSPCLFRWTAMR